MACFGGMLLSCVLILSNAAMLVLVVIFGKIFCKYGYSFSLTLPLYGVVFFYVVFVCCERSLNPFLALHPIRRREATWTMHRQSFANGFAWSMNYVFLLIANPFVPGLYQVVLNESNLVIVFVLSTLLLGNRHSLGQWAMFALLIIGGLLPIIGSQRQGGSTAYWYLMYLLGAWGIGIANTITENVLRNVRVESGPESSVHLISVPQFLFLTNMYGILVVLAFFWVPMLAHGEQWASIVMEGMTCIWTGRCPEEDHYACPHHGDSLGIGALWGSSTLSFICAFVAAAIQRKRDAVYVTVAYSLAPVFSMVIFMTPMLMGQFYEKPSGLEVLSNMVALFAGLSYKYLSHSHHDQSLEAPRRTWLTAAFRLEPFTDTASSRSISFVESPQGTPQNSFPGATTV